MLKYVNDIVFFKKITSTPYDLYCRVSELNQNNNTHGYAGIGDKFGIKVFAATYGAVKSSYKEIYNNHRNGWLCGTFYSNEKDTGSDTIEVNITLYTFVSGVVDDGYVDFEFFLIPHDSDPADYPNVTTYNGTISPISEIVDKRIYKTGYKVYNYNMGSDSGISMGRYQMRNVNGGLGGLLIQSDSCNFHFSCYELYNGDPVLGKLSGIYTITKNRYSTTIPYLKLNIEWEMLS